MTVLITELSCGRIAISPSFIDLVFLLVTASYFFRHLNTPLHYFWCGELLLIITAVPSDSRTVLITKQPNYRSGARTFCAI